MPRRSVCQLKQRQNNNKRCNMEVRHSMLERILHDLSDITFGLISFVFGLILTKQLHQKLKIEKFIPYWVLKTFLIFFGAFGILVVILGFFMEPY
jgi:hypothetical protein